jgi:hypothetical protein
MSKTVGRKKIIKYSLDLARKKKNIARNYMAGEYRTCTDNHYQVKTKRTTKEGGNSR